MQTITLKLLAVTLQIAVGHPVSVVLLRLFQFSFLLYHVLMLFIMHLRLSNQSAQLAFQSPLPAFKYFLQAIRSFMGTIQSVMGVTRFNRYFRMLQLAQFHVYCPLHHHSFIL